MAITDPSNTLAFHSSRVLAQHRDMSNVPLANVSARVSEFLANDSDPSTSPEVEALWFYGMNHGMALISGEFAPLQPLPPKHWNFVDTYYTKLGPKAVRAFYYLLLICTREFRHNKSLSGDTPKISQKFGEKVAGFFNSINGGEGSIHTALLKSPPDTTLGQYVRALQWGFYHSKWAGGYGGPAWGKVTDCLVNFCTGVFNAEMMLDTIWTLCHNNGPVFNKGICYGHYSSNLIRLLDIQRSGQIPEAVLETDANLATFVKPELLDHMQWLQQAYCGTIGSYVDWYVVEALGSVNSYPNEKTKQSQLHGMSPKATEFEKAALALQQAKLAQAKKEKEEFEKSNFEVMPGVFLKKIQRAA